MNKTTKTKAVIYARVSSKEQEETGYSLNSQEELLSNYSTGRNDFSVVKVFRISESASGKIQRTTFTEMIKFMDKNKINILVCEKVDRLTRNFKDALIIDEWLDQDEKREVHLVKDSLIMHKHSKSQEKLNWGIRILFAKNYTDNLSEEVKKGQKQKIKEGWLPTTPPLGYKTVGEKGHKIHVIDELVAPYIKEMFALYATGNYSTVALGEKMYKQGFRSRSGIQVVKSQIHKILSEPFYYGKLVWNGNLYEGKHEPLISKDLFDQVQAKMSRGAIPYHNKGLTELRGKIFCGSCNKTVTWELQKGTMYGGCKQCKAQLGKDKKYIHQEDLEGDLLAHIASVAPLSEKVIDVLNQALKESHSEEMGVHETQTRNINNQLERIRQRMKNMYIDKIDERISGDFYDEQVTQFAEEKEALLHSLKKLEADNTEYYRVGFMIHEIALRAREIYLNEKTSIEERRMLLAYAFSNITVLAGNIKAEYTKPFAFLAEWMPRVNEVLELEKTLGTKGKESTFVPSHPIVLPLLDAFRTLNWNKIEQELEFSGILSFFEISYT